MPFGKAVGALGRMAAGFGNAKRALPSNNPIPPASKFGPPPQAGMWGNMMQGVGNLASKFGGMQPKIRPEQPIAPSPEVAPTPPMETAMAPTVQDQVMRRPMPVMGRARARGPIMY